MEERNIVEEISNLYKNTNYENVDELRIIMDNLKLLLEESDYNEEVIVEYGKALFNLVKETSLKDNDLILKELEELQNLLYENEEINILYAKALFNSFNKNNLEEIKKAIQKLEYLKDIDSNVDEIMSLYIKALASSNYWGNLELLKEMSDRLGELLYEYRENDEEIAKLYADSLIEIIKLQSQKAENEVTTEDIKKYINELYGLVEQFEDNEEIEAIYSKASVIIKSKESKNIFDGRTAPVNSTATSKDYLNREHISNAISLYIRAKKESISTIGIFSTWGNGKSSFIKNILEKLKEKPDKNEVEILPIEIDAVFSDDCEKIWIIIYKKLIEEYKNQISNCRFIQSFLKLIFHLCLSGILYLFFPLLSIKPLFRYVYIFLVVYLFLFKVFIEFKKYYKWLNNLSLKIQDFLLETIVYFKLFYKPRIILIANVVVFFMLKSHFMKYTEDVKIANLQTIKGSLITGVISFIWIFCDFTKNIVSVLNKESFISAYKHEEKLGFKSVIHEKINNVIEKIIDGKNRNILIIVDELDRSSLDKINEIIESTHILLNNNNLMFLFSVNPRQIGKALLLKEKESLNNEIDIYKHGRHYIEKYMDIYLYLPFSKDYSSLLDSIVDESLEEKVTKDSGNVPTKDSSNVSTKDSSNVSTKDSSNVPTKDSSKVPTNSTTTDNNKIKEIMKFSKDEKQEIKITINKITEYSNLTPRKVKTIITLSTLAVQIFSSRNNESTREDRISLMKFILINLGLLDFMDMSEILKYEGSTYYKFLEKVISKTEKTNNHELIRDINERFIDSYGKEYLSLFAEKLDFN